MWLTAKRLNAALAGRPVTTFDLRVPQLATTDLRADTITEVLARGKHILMRFAGGLTLHSHLRMDGSWRIAAAGRATGVPRARHASDSGPGRQRPAGSLSDCGCMTWPSSRRRRGRTGRPSRARPARPRLGGSGRARPAAGPTRGADRRGPPRSAQPGRHWQHVQGRSAIHRRRASVDTGRRRRRPRTRRRHRLPAAATQP